MEYILYLVDFILHIDKHLDELTQAYGLLTYFILFLIVFCETGLVVTPILPGDSLLFAAGAIAARGSLNAHVMAVALIVAAVLGDAANYAIGHSLGPKVLKNENSRIFRREYLEKTRKFYDRYGGKTIIIARFVPIVRTFAPFLAGVGEMSYLRFAAYNVIGAIAWVTSFVYAGYFFGGVEIVKKNFTLVIFAIIIISIMPAAIEIMRSRRQRESDPGSESAKAVNG